jgi:FkbM family methyltransferase
MKKIVQAFDELLSRDFVFCDVGARGGIPPHWVPFNSLIETIGFEPDEIEISRLIKENIRGRYFNCAVSDREKESRLHLTKVRGCSSLYEPNMAFLKQFHGSDWFEVEKVVGLKTTSIDVLFEKEGIHKCDFIKIDVQGAELDVLKGGMRCLKEHVLGIEVEVEFQSVYRNQPLFSDIDHYIRDQFGFEIQDLKKYYWKYPEGINYGSAKGKLIFGEALYFRPPDSIFHICKRQSLQNAKDTILMAILMGMVFGYFDYALSILRRSLDEKYFESHQLISLESAIKSYGKGIRYSGQFASYLSEGFRLLYSLFQPTLGGWGSIGQPLGSRKKYGVFF